MEEEKETEEPSRIEKRRSTMDESLYSDGGTRQGVEKEIDAQTNRSLAEIARDFGPSALAAISPMLTWATASYMGEQVVSKSGLSSDYAIPVIVLSAIVLAIVLRVKDDSLAGWTQIIGGVIISVIAIHHAQWVSEAKDRLMEQPEAYDINMSMVDYQIGIGLWLLLFAGILMMSMGYVRMNYD